ncbi:MAG TPA: redoxin domain-containing protein [Longimicrobiaceae bacterium]|nr:redoxin domain-containing protein [Longimicrobiaceae bacterium]
MKPLGKPVAPGERIPDLSFEDGSGCLTSLRAKGRQGVVVVLTHGPGCDACQRYLAELAAADAEHREWDGRVIALVPARTGRTGAAPAAALPFPVLADPERRTWAALGIEGAAVVIADQWGEVHEVSCAGAGHALPSAEDITQWLRFLAIRCPECEGEAL